jgi:ferredoxin
MTVQVHFLPNDVSVVAKVGEPLLEVAARAGVTIPTGCLMGSCHACEVELNGQEDLRVVRENNCPITVWDVSTPLRCAQHDRGDVIPTNGRNLYWITF